MNLQQRVADLNSHNLGLNITLYGLRKYFAYKQIKLRNLKIKLELNERQQSTQSKQLKYVLPIVIDLIEKRKRILFVDETVFTSN